MSLLRFEFCLGGGQRRDRSLSDLIDCVTCTFYDVREERKVPEGPDPVAIQLQNAKALVVLICTRELSSACSILCRLDLTRKFRRNRE
jgi:hypothetical protein